MKDSTHHTKGLQPRPDATKRINTYSKNKNKYIRKLERVPDRESRCICQCKLCHALKLEVTRFQSQLERVLLFVTCYMLSHVWIFATPGSIARQAPLSMGFPRPGYSSGFPPATPGAFSVRQDAGDGRVQAEWEPSTGMKGKTLKRPQSQLRRKTLPSSLRNLPIKGNFLFPGFWSESAF